MIPVKEHQMGSANVGSTESAESPALPTICSCPPGFDLVEKDSPSKGCLQNTSSQDTCTTIGARMETMCRGVSEDVPPPPSKVVKEKKGKGLVVVGISLMGCSFVFSVVFLLLWLFTCRPKLKVFHEQHRFNPMGLRAFSYQELDAATDGFKVEIGRGAFGTVYKGTLSDGRAIAVKKLNDLFKKENPQEGEKEFRTEKFL